MRRKQRKVKKDQGKFGESPFEHAFYNLRLLKTRRKKKVWVKGRVLEGSVSEVAGGLGRIKYQNGRGASVDEQESLRIMKGSVEGS